MENSPSATSAEDGEFLICDIYAGTFDDDEAMQKLNEELKDSSSPMELDIRRAIPEPSTAPSSYRKTLKDMLRKYNVTRMQLDSPDAYIDFQQIHPLFRKENFTPNVVLGELAGKAWELMTPALALATKFITTPELQAFWHHLLLGEPAVVNGKRYLARSSLEDDIQRASEAFNDLLMLLADRVSFLWLPAKLPKLGACSGAFGSSIFKILRMFDRVGIEKIMADYGYCDEKHGIICLSSWYFYHLVSNESVVRTDDQAMMRLQFDLAQTICHELAHCIYQWRNLEHPEAYIYLSDGMAEAGFSWSQNVIGADVNFSGGLANGVGHMQGASFAHLFTYPGMRTVISMRYIEAWFRKDTWAHIGEVMQGNLLKLPSPAGIHAPVFRVAERFVKGHGIYTILYKDREVVFPEAFIGKMDGPPDGVDPEEWFAELREREMEEAVAEGISSEHFCGPKGNYEGRVQP